MKHFSSAIVYQNMVVTHVFEDFDDVWSDAIDALRKKVREREKQGCDIALMESTALQIDRQHCDFRLYEMKEMILHAIQVERLK